MPVGGRQLADLLGPVAHDAGEVKGLWRRLPTTMLCRYRAR